MTTSDPDFGLLHRFLGIFDRPALAHAREELTADQESGLRAFARGELDESARRALIPLLARNTEALARLALFMKSSPGAGHGR